MNKLLVSASLAAISAAALESAMADDDVNGPKYWSVGATLRGFYDDNYNLSTTKHGSAGFEVLPTVSAHVPLQQTDLGIRYSYGLYYYQDRQDHGSNPIDQTHQVDLWVDHAFNERWKANFEDSFASGQEPELLTPNPVTGQAAPYRVQGDNISNHGTMSVDTEWTRLLGTTLSYNNGYYDYQNSGAYINGLGQLVSPGGSFNGGASLAGLLNRDEESVAFDTKWHILPETTAILGYSFSWVNYLGGEPIAITPVPGRFGEFVYHSSDRDSLSHYAYVGVEQSFTPNLTANVRAGANYNDVYADPIDPQRNWAPYADLSLSYTYLPGSYVTLGFTHDMSASDQVAPDAAGSITQYAEDSVVYLSVNHRITEKLIASAIGRVQFSDYQGGAANSMTSTDYGVSFNLSYQINPHFSVDTGYNYDDLQSDIAGYQYSRNRVYLGVTANY